MTTDSQAGLEAVPAVAEPAAAELARLWAALTAPGRKDTAWLFAAAQRREGVTELVAGLAALLVRQNPKIRIGLLETNWRHPRLAKMFGLPAGPGLLGLLGKAVPFDEAVGSLAGGRLLVLPAGRPADGQAPALTAEALPETLDTFKARADYVLVDAAAVNRYPDAAIVGPLTDGVVLVVHAGATRRESVAEAQRRLELSGARVLGIVLNRRSDPIPAFLYKRL